MKRILKREKKSLIQNKPPRISTRGYFDLKNGKKLKTKYYRLYPKSFFDGLKGTKELVIVIHGLRNNNSGAMAKIIFAKNRLKKIGYLYPVVGFSYDSNTFGAHLKKYEKKALLVGQTIAKRNGKNLSKFITDFKSIATDTKIRLVGHSLGSLVILSTIRELSKNPGNDGILESVHMFGASILTSDIHGSKKEIKKIINNKIVNYYAPSDEVLLDAKIKKYVNSPLGLGKIKERIPKFSQRKVLPKNHRFASYLETLKSFP